MLDIVHFFAAVPSLVLHTISTPQVTLLAYPSADAVVLLNARSLAFVRSLAFCEVFPSTRDSKQHVTCLAIDAGMKLIIAALGPQVAIWSLSGVQADTWIVHSSLVLTDGHDVTALDCKSGLLAVASPRGLSVFNLILENDLPTWSRKWFITAQAASTIQFSPSLTLLATSSQIDNTVRIYSTTAGRQIQALPHPRKVSRVSWRYSRTSSRDDLILYTITSDATLRIFMPVLDAPHRLQLHAALDVPFGAPSSELNKPSNVFWLDRDILQDALTAILAQRPPGSEHDSRYLRVQEMKDEGWDVFARILGDGTWIVHAVANIDRRPPTLLRHVRLLQLPPSPFRSAPSHFMLLPTPTLTALLLVTSPPLSSYILDPLSFFGGQPGALSELARITDGTDAPMSSSKIVRFVRTPEGRGVGVVRESVVETWHTRKGGPSAGLRWTGNWPTASHVVVLDGGKRTVMYDSATQLLTLCPSTPTVSLSIPRITSLFGLPSAHGSASIIGVTAECAIVHIRVSHLSVVSPTLTVHAQTRLPLPSPPKMILPVDPMAWSDTPRGTGAGNGTHRHDVLLSVAQDGELAFWGLEGNGRGLVNGHGAAAEERWTCTGQVKTGRTGFSMARCSSAKKSALVMPGPDGEELTIWDSNQSEFASGLEYRRVFSANEPINDLDWTSTPDLQSILAVGFANHVIILCQQRMTYFDQEPAWGMCSRISIGHMTAHPISDSIWLTGGSLLIGAGHQMFQYGHPASSSEPGLFEHVARMNGPLEDYHPQMILQCLLWDKVELVKDIIVNLARDLDETGSRGVVWKWRTLPVERFLAAEQLVPSTSQKRAKPYSLLFDGPQQVDDSSDDDGFSRALVGRLIQQLEAEPLAHLTPNENAHLIVLIQTTLEVEEQRRALDANGLRYLISMRSFYILNRRASSPGMEENGGSIARQTGRRERLRYRDIVWAFHSESQEILLDASTAACGGKMTWPDARALGVFMWLNSIESMKTNMEAIARNQYMVGDSRDPTACCLYYFALGKVKLVHGLWRQAAWHKEQSVMLKFLSNDFNEPRWRTAALKNAYALLSKQRHEYAAAFFLLGGSLKDAVNVCISKLQDVQLAIALARVVEQGDDGPVLKEVIRNTVIPLAFKNGNRWLGSWAFWLLRRRDLAVRILVSPLKDITLSLDVAITELGDPNYDDPSLSLLFSQLKSKTLQAAKGTSEISGRTEFKFVLQTARVFCRMGCHVLALDLVRSWSFDRPTSVIHANTAVDGETETVAPLQHSPTFTRRPGFTLSPHLRRRSSIMIDMEVPSETPTRVASPESPAQLPVASLPTASAATLAGEGDLPTRKAGLGNLMQSAKYDVKVPEFDMSAFF